MVEIPQESPAAPASTEEEEDVGADYPIPAPEPVLTSFDALKGRIRQHYELASDYYYSLWGEHIHHGYFLEATDTKERAQLRLIELLLQRSDLPAKSTVLDVGCGIGGTSRYLAREHGCTVTGITISGQQVAMAKRLSSSSTGPTTTAESDPEKTNAVSDDTTTTDDDEEGPIPLGSSNGSVQFKELDAEEMGTSFPASTSFDAVWISEAMSHLPNKPLFFANAFKLLNPNPSSGTGGKLIIADWFKAENLTSAQHTADITPIEDGMLLPPLCTVAEYTAYAEKAGFTVYAEPMDISDNVKKTWDISWSLVQSPSLWALAFSQGRDFIAFLQAFRAMRRGFGNGTFRYAVLVFEKKEKTTTESVEG